MATPRKGKAKVKVTASGKRLVTDKQAKPKAAEQE
jgi:hypothetical protein